MRPRLKQTQWLDEDIQKRNETAQYTYRKITDDIIQAKTELSNVQIQKSQEASELNLISAKMKMVAEELEKSKESAKEMVENTRLLALSQMQNSLESAAERERIKYEKEISSYREDFLKVMEECASELNHNIDALNQSYATLLSQFTDLEQKTAAAVEANKREQEKRDNQNFYRLVISEEDIKEIKKLREVAQYLRDSEPLNKVIYKVYYENPYTDLVGRVVGKNIKTGIYKITNLENQMCYIGQAADIAARWKQHIKRGVGAETPTRNKLYPAMYKLGVENFSFEIIEECSRDMLNEREQFWQDYFKAKEFGYSIK